MVLGRGGVRGKKEHLPIPQSVSQCLLAMAFFFFFEEENAFIGGRGRETGVRSKKIIESFSEGQMLRVVI